MTAAQAPTTSGRWLFGPVPDLLLGCGVAWMLVAFAHAGLGADLQRFVPGAALVFAFSLPHYGATLVRVYESTEERRRYAFFTVWVSLLLVLCFVGALYSVLFGSLILTLYLTWSPWHYTGQNYGVALMLWGRRGVQVAPRAKRLLHLSFVASFLLTLLALHGAERQANYAPGSTDGSIYQILPLGIPQELAAAAIVGVGALYVGSLLAAFALLVRDGARPRALAPGAVLVVTQGLWFAAPVLARRFGLLDGLSLEAIYSPYGFLWIAGAHAVQYLWVTAYYARRRNAATTHLGYLGKAALAGFAVWTLPTLLFGPRLLGGLTGGIGYDAGLALLVAAVVNLHHFLLDGAIWKLRDGRVARLLVRGQTPEVARGAGEGLRRRRIPVAPLVWAAGALCIAVSVWSIAEREYGVVHALERGDLARARSALDHLDWVGRDSARLRLELGRAFARHGQEQAARRELLRSIEMRPTAAAWDAVATLHWQAQAWEDAAKAWERALALEPDDVVFLYRSGLAWVKAGRPGQGEQRLARAASLAPERELIARSLERVRGEGAADAAEASSNAPATGAARR